MMDENGAGNIAEMISGIRASLDQLEAAVAGPEADEMEDVDGMEGMEGKENMNMMPGKEVEPAPRSPRIAIRKRKGGGGMRDMLGI